MTHVAARKVMRFQWIAPNIDAGFHRSNTIVHDQTDRHFAQPHPDHFTETHRRVCDPCPEPETEKVKKNNCQHECEDRQHCDADKIKCVHGSERNVVEALVTSAERCKAVT